MSLAAGHSRRRKRPVVSSPLLVSLLLILALQIWVCQARAIRAVPGQTRRVAAAPEPEQSVDRAELWRRYFESFGHNRNETAQDSKRRVPSCPDPLHNK